MSESEWIIVQYWIKIEAINFERKNTNVWHTIRLELCFLFIIWNQCLEHISSARCAPLFSSLFYETIQAETDDCGSLRPFLIPHPSYESTAYLLLPCTHLKIWPWEQFDGVVGTRFLLTSEWSWNQEGEEVAWKASGIARSWVVSVIMHWKS